MMTAMNNNKLTSRDALNAVKAFADQSEMMTAMNNNKLTSRDALNAVKAFADQSEKNVAFGVLADTEHGKVSTFIKGEASDILSLIVMQMAKDNDFKEILFKAVAFYKFAPVQKIIENYEQD